MASRFGRRQIVLAPLRRGHSRPFIALAPLGLAACLLTLLVSLYQGVNGGLGAAFRRYGANVVVLPAPSADVIPAAAAAPALAAFPGVGIRYQVAGINALRGAPRRSTAPVHDHAVMLAGADLAALRRLNPEWKLVPAASPSPAAAPPAGVWVGVTAARLLHLAPGGVAEVTLGGHSARWPVVAIVETGGSEDSQIFVPYARLAALALPTAAGFTTLEFRVPAADMPAARHRLAALLPGAMVEPVRQISGGETAVLLRTRTLLLVCSLLILLTVGLCVAAVLNTLALERHRDYGLMKALGGSDARLLAHLMGESALLGAAAAVAGALVGGLGVGLLGWSLFRLWLWPAPLALLSAAAGTLALALTAALVPWPLLRAAQPALLLRGEQR